MRSTLVARAIFAVRLLLSMVMLTGIIGATAVPAVAAGMSVKTELAEAEPKGAPSKIYVTQSTSTDTCSNGTKKTKVKSTMTVVSTANPSDGTVTISSASLKLAKTNLRKFVKGQVAFTYITAKGSSAKYFRYDDSNPANPLTFFPGIIAHQPKGVSLTGGVYFKLKGGKKVWSCPLRVTTPSV